jgi:hypothetical protein
LRREGLGHAHHNHTSLAVLERVILMIVFEADKLSFPIKHEIDKKILEYIYVDE